MFVFCIESSHQRGMGHLYRSMVLASALIKRDGRVRFLLNDHGPSLAVLRDNGFEAHAVDLTDYATGWERKWIGTGKPPLIWINDRLDTDRRHTRNVKTLPAKLVTFDDRGSGAADADLHIAALAAVDDANCLKGQNVLHGIKYLMLNSEIEQFRRRRTVRDSVLVTLGGSDTYGVTPRVVSLLAKHNINSTILLGPSFAHDSELQAVLALAAPGLFVTARGVPSMAAEMVRHDLAITGGGMTPFEANAAGLPCIVIANELFEIPVGQYLQRLGGCIFAGHHQSLDESKLRCDVPLHEMSTKGMAAIDLNGVSRVVAAIEVLAA